MQKLHIIRCHQKNLNLKAIILEIDRLVEPSHEDAIIEDLLLVPF